MFTVRFHSSSETCTPPLPTLLWYTSPTFRKIVRNYPLLLAHLGRLVFSYFHIHTKGALHLRSRLSHLRREGTSSCLLYTMARYPAVWNTAPRTLNRHQPRGDRQHHTPPISSVQGKSPQCSTSHEQSNERLGPYNILSTHATVSMSLTTLWAFLQFSRAIDDRVNSLTGEKTYRLVDGKPARRPSGTTSPYTMQSPAGQPWAATTSPVMHSPGPVMHSPGHAIHSPGHVIHNPGHVLHSPGHAMLSPSPAALQAGYGAPQYAATTMVPYHQPGHGGGVVPPGHPAPTPTGEAVGYRASKYYVRPRRSKKSWMWTQQ